MFNSNPPQMFGGTNNPLNIVQQQMTMNNSGTIPFVQNNIFNQQQPQQQQSTNIFGQQSNPSQQNPNVPKNYMQMRK